MLAPVSIGFDIGFVDAIVGRHFLDPLRKTSCPVRRAVAAAIAMIGTPSWLGRGLVRVAGLIVGHTFTVCGG